MQQLTTFEAMLVDRLNATGQVQAKTFMDASYPALYGILIKVDGATVPYRLTKGSGTGDPPMTDAEQEAHAAHVHGPVDGREQPGVKVRYETASEIYIVPVKA
jgi:hypothetical protein